MKNLYKYLLSALALVVLFGSVSELEAKDTPPKPIKMSIKIDIKESFPVKGDATISWVDSDTRIEAGDLYVITQHTLLANEKKSEEIVKIRRFADSTERYSYRVSDLRPGSYCFDVYLLDETTGDASETSEKVCGNVKDGEPRMAFLKKQDYIRLDSDGNGEIVAKVINNTNCEATLNWEMSDLILKSSQPLNSGGVVYKVQAPKEGLYKAKINLINNCDNKVVDVMNVVVCYGECDSTDNRPSLYFSPNTKFVHEVKAGMTWRYDVDAVSKDQCEIKYYLSDALIGDNTTPEGMTIDEDTGVLSWEKTVAGYYSIPVIVEATCDNGLTYERIRGVFKLRVGHNNLDFATLVVEFYDETDEVKDFYGTATVWSADRDPNSATGFPYAKSVEINGNMAYFGVPAGKYYLRANAKGYKTQFYKEAFNINDAEVIEVGKNDTLELSMMLHSIPMPNFHTVSGQVVDARTGEPVESIVTFQSIQSMIGGNDSIDANGNAFHITRVKTDANGRYMTELPDIHSYYAYADAIPKMNTRYERQFYEGADTYFEADIIFLKEDKSGVDFKLNKKEIENGMISGSVSSESNLIVESTVIALSVDGNANKAVTRTENGNYKFGNLNYGKYVLLSLPADRSYLPGYYVTGDVASLTWEDATVIGVDENMAAMQHDIVHAEFEKGSARGIAQFRGRLIKKWKGMAPGEGGGDDSESISGAIVTLTNAEGKVYDYSVSNTYGEFEMDALAQGTYTLSINKLGYQSHSEEVEINYTESLVFGSDIQLTPSLTTNVDYDTFDENGLTVSPMPVLDNSTVRFTGEAGTAEIELISINGDVVFSESISTTAGENTYELNSNEFVSGQYILVIRNGEMITAGKITVVK